MWSGVASTPAVWSLDEECFRDPFALLWAYFEKGDFEAHSPVLSERTDVLFESQSKIDTILFECGKQLRERTPL